MLLDEGEDAEDAADADGALMAVDVVADGGDGRTGALGGGEQGESLRWDAGGPVVVGDAMPPPLGAQVLTQQLAGARVEEADVDVVPLQSTRPRAATGRNSARTCRRSSGPAVSVCPASRRKTAASKPSSARLSSRSAASGSPEAATA